MELLSLIKLNELGDRIPAHILAENTDLVLVKYDDKVSILYGRCLHRGALMSDGHIEGDNLICGVHGWDYRYDTGVSEYNNSEVLKKFTTYIEDGYVKADKAEILAFEKEHPQAFDRNSYLGQYADTAPKKQNRIQGT